MSIYNRPKIANYFTYLIDIEQFTLLLFRLNLNNILSGCRYYTYRKIVFILR